MHYYSSSYMSSEDIFVWGRMELLLKFGEMFYSAESLNAKFFEN